VKTRTGTWVAKSCPELAEEIRNTSGQNSIACSIRAFLDTAADLLKTQCELICEKQEIIRSGGPGCRYHEWITVRDARSAELESAERDGTPTSRRQEIFDLLREGGKLRSTCIATHLGCSLKTVKRELDALRWERRIEFVGPSKTGTYQLIGT
jgi:DNA-binding NarL/FixJ family response regulator